MKGVCLLLCIALPHAFGGYMFKHQLPQQRNFDVHPLDYIDQYQYKPMREQSDSNSNEQQEISDERQDTNSDVASYIKKYIEVRRYGDRPTQHFNVPHERTFQQLNAMKQRNYEQQPQQQYNNYQWTSRKQNQGIQEQANVQRYNDQAPVDIQYNYPDHTDKQYTEQESRKQQYDINQKYERGIKKQPIQKRIQLYKTQPFVEQNQVQQVQRQGQENFNFQKQIIKPFNKQQFQHREANSDEESNSQEMLISIQFQPDQKVVEKSVPSFGDAISWNRLSIAVQPDSHVTNKHIENIFRSAYDTMPHLTEEQKKDYHHNYQSALQSHTEDVQLNATEMLKNNGYNVEEHHIQTEDGYILTLLRIPPKQVTNDVQKKPVVFLMHSLLGSADDWVLMGPGKSLAYLLADAGYDVWLGNARGNKYSRQHVYKHPALPDFWKFGVDEIAQLDMPAMIDYTLQVAQQNKIYYIGHSLGTTVFFALTSARPEYNDKFIGMFALSPMVYMSHVRSPLFRMIAPNSELYEQLKHQLGHGEFTPEKEVLSTIGGQMCYNEIGCQHVCSNVNFVVAGVNVQHMDQDLMPVIMSHLPAGASTRLIKHYGQLVASKDFRMYDYGVELNQQVYGSTLPPHYNLSAVKVPVSLYYSQNDWLAHPMDVEQLRAELPNVADNYQVPEENFGSLDFQFATTVPKTVYNKIIESMKNTTTY